MISYQKIRLEGGVIVYQRAVDGSVTGYFDASGSALYDMIPDGVGSEVMDDCESFDWMD